MTLSEFADQRALRPCRQCGGFRIVTEHNPNNNGLLVCCASCGSKRPWGSLLYLKQNARKVPSRPPLPQGETLDSVWAKYDDRCVICAATKMALAVLGIGRQVHHVVPFAEAGHRGPLVPICSHCHPVVSDRQRVYWFYQRVVTRTTEGSVEVDRELPKAQGE